MHFNIKKNQILLAAAIILFIIYLFIMDPSKKGFYPPCPFFYLTGYYCPGCGTLRALHNLMHGNIYKALSYNILTIMLIPLVMYLLLIKLRLIKNPRLINHVFSKSFYTVLLSIIFMFWVLRNIPYYPFTLLAP